jgi:cytochrome c biogenesis protein CcdA
MSSTGINKMDITLGNILLTFLAGITSVASPCVLPVIPIIVTGTSEDYRHRPLLIVLGLSIAFILMGIVSTLFGSLVAGRILYIEKAVGLLIVLFGALMLFDINPFKKITLLSRFQGGSGGRWSGLIMGLALGIIWIPCIGPMLSGVLALVAGKANLATGIVLLAIYSLGFSIPMLLAAYSSQFFRQKIAVVQKYPLVIRFISGTILILFGLYIFQQGLVSFGF